MNGLRSYERQCTCVGMRFRPGQESQPFHMCQLSSRRDGFSENSSLKVDLMQGLRCLLRHMCAMIRYPYVVVTAKDIRAFFNLFERKSQNLHRALRKPYNHIQPLDKVIVFTHCLPAPYSK